MQWTTEVYPSTAARWSTEASPFTRNGTTVKTHPDRPGQRQNLTSVVLQPALDSIAHAPILTRYDTTTIAGGHQLGFL